MKWVSSLSIKKEIKFGKALITVCIFIFIIEYALNEFEGGHIYWGEEVCVIIILVLAIYEELKYTDRYVGQKAIVTLKIVIILIVGVLLFIDTPLGIASLSFIAIDLITNIAKERALEKEGKK